jgi:hypothetical protein
MQVVLASECISPSPSRTLKSVFVPEFFSFVFLLSEGHNSYVYLSICQDNIRTTYFSTATSPSILVLATLALRGYHLHVVLIGLSSSHNIRDITTLQLRGDVSSSDFTFNLFSSLTVYDVPAVTADDVRIYLVGYILCIISCHICQNIFDRIDIMYYKLPYISGDTLPLKTLVLYIYWSRDTMQYNQQLYAIYYCKSFFQSLIGIASPCCTSTPLIDEVGVACPSGRNNDTRD